MCVSALCVHMPTAGIGLPGAGVTGSYETPEVSWELKQGPMGE